MVIQKLAARSFFYRALKRLNRYILFSYNYLYIIFLRFFVFSSFVLLIDQKFTALLGKEALNKGERNIARKKW